MANTEILSIAFVRPFEGSEAAVLETLRELYAVLRSKQYSRDLLYRDAQDSGLLVNLRYWASAEARGQAQEDPDVHRHWRRLAEISVVERVYEQLEPL